MHRGLRALLSFMCACNVLDLRPRSEPASIGPSGGRTIAILTDLRAKVRRPRPRIPARIDSVPEALRGPLVALLQRFQLGEAGEGRVASEARASTDPALDDALREATALYVREEGRHAAILAEVLAALGAPTIKHATAELLFRRGRRLLGLRTKMLVIACAEVVGVAAARGSGTASPAVPSPRRRTMSSRTSSRISIFSRSSSRGSSRPSERSRPSAPRRSRSRSRRS